MKPFIIRVSIAIIVVSAAFSFSFSSEIQEAEMVFVEGGTFTMGCTGY